MRWSHDDTVLASCGREGAVYSWDVVKETRLCETIIKSNPFNGVVTTRDGKNTLAIGTDGHIRELMNSEVYRDVVLINMPLDAIVLSAEDNLLFVSGKNDDEWKLSIDIFQQKN